LWILGFQPPKCAAMKAGKEAAATAHEIDPLALATKAGEAETLLKAIANAHRLMILCELQAGEVCVTDLQNALGLGQSSLSQHLARLREDGIVKTRRDSRMIYYSLADARVAGVIQMLAELFCTERG